MSAKRFEELRDHILDLARMDANPNELRELKRCMWQLNVTSHSLVTMYHGSPTVISTREDMSTYEYDPIHYIEDGDENGLKQFRNRLNNVDISV